MYNLPTVFGVGANLKINERNILALRLNISTYYNTFLIVSAPSR